jgi:hypothetical protein
VSNKLAEQIELELEQLNHLFVLYRTLLDRGQREFLDEIETAALGAMLHSFYNGVENVFKNIARELDAVLPRREFWHTELLEAMAVPGARRPAVISHELRDRLKDYLQFRHVFRSAYAFVLRWDKMAPLAAQFEPTLRLLQAELKAFVRRIDSRTD